MNLTIPCPDCQRALRVPENLLGQAVKCPSCGHTFIAPETVPEPPHRPAAPLPQDDRGEQPLPSMRRVPDDDDDEGYEQVPHRGRSRREKPGKVQAIALMVLCGGIFATVWGFGWTLLSGFTCCLWPGLYYGVVLGIMAIVKGANLLGEKAYRVAPPQGIAIMMVINILNIDPVNLTLGIVTLIFLGDREVKDYFRS